MNSLQSLRQTGQRVLLFVVLANAFVVPLLALLAAPERALPAFFVLASGAGFTWALARLEATRRFADVAIAITLTMGPAASLYVFAGHPWQVDMHMTFFATLGV